MIEYQIKIRGIKNKILLNTFLEVERHLFVPDSMKNYAYTDQPLLIGESQTISQPYIIALMIDLLDLKKDDMVLEIGTGSGYQTALLAKMAKQVFSIERIESLAKKAKEKLRKMCFTNIFIQIRDGTLGWISEKENTREMRFDAIIVSAAAPKVPKKLIDQLAEGGRMVIPYGKRFSQDLLRLTKKQGKIKKENFGACMFVPLIGKNGWQVRNDK